MRFGSLPWMLVFVIALLALCGTASPATAGFISSDAATFVGEFRAFLNDFPRWDAAHLELPLIALAMTPDQQRPAMLLLLWDLWMHDHPNNPVGAVNVTLVTNVLGSSPPVTGVPGNGGGGGTISSNPPGGGGGTGGPPKSAPEPSTLALIACGGLGLFAFRLVRARRGQSSDVAGTKRLIAS